MDLRQTKLTKNEWDALEVPVPKQEHVILKMIYEGYSNLNHTFNYTLSLMAYIKISHDSYKFHGYFYTKYFLPLFQKIHKQNELSYPILTFPDLKNKIKLKKADEIRIKNSEKKLDTVKNELFEFVILDLLRKMFKNKKKIVLLLFYNYTYYEK